MEYDRQTEAMIHWAKVGREWLFLDSSVRFEMLDRYPDFFIPIQNASMSSVTYFADLVVVSSLWKEPALQELKDELGMVSPNLKKAIKSLATMVSLDGKTFADF